MATVTIVEGSVPAVVASALRDAGHDVRAVRATSEVPGARPDLPDVVVLSDEELSSDAVRSVREALPGVRVLAARRGAFDLGSGAPDLVLPADADPAVWAMALAALDLARELPDPALEEARTSLTTVVQVARRAFDALRAAGPAEGPGGRPAEMLGEVEVRLERSFELLLRVTLDRLERRIEGFAGRSGRIAALCRGLASELGAPPGTGDAAEAAGRFHDLGMHLVVSPAALRRSGPLRAQEVRAVHRHPSASVDALTPLRLSDDALSGIRDHHERLDGSGYPRRARADALGMTARVVAVADCFEALTHPRPHRAALSQTEAVDAIEREGQAGRFDPMVCTALRSVLGLRRGRSVTR